jgi:hypothetical protein
VKRGVWGGGGWDRFASLIPCKKRKKLDTLNVIFCGLQNRLAGVYIGPKNRSIQRGMFYKDWEKLTKFASVLILLKISEEPVFTFPLASS